LSSFDAHCLAAHIRHTTGAIIRLSHGYDVKESHRNCTGAFLVELIPARPSDTVSRPHNYLLILSCYDPAFDMSKFRDGRGVDAQQELM
jgi:hypothetical protein